MVGTLSVEVSSQFEPIMASAPASSRRSRVASASRWSVAGRVRVRFRGGGIVERPGLYITMSGETRVIAAYTSA